MIEPSFPISNDPRDWALAALLLALWLIASWRWLRKPTKPQTEGANCLVIYASQTGQAEELAQEAHARIARVLEPHGQSARLASADAVDGGDLAAADTLVFVTSTTGEGEAPANALRFEREIMAGTPDLAGKRTAVLALGDRRYVHFCAFGKRVAHWAERCGGDLGGALITVDDHAPADMARWDALLTAAGYPGDGIEASAGASQWAVLKRVQVAPPSVDSQGTQSNGGLYHLVLRADNQTTNGWEIGDLFELHTLDGHLREYSIANRPGGRELHLFVRRVLDNGRAGRGSGLLTQAEPGRATISGRIRQHRSFRPPTGSGPLLAIGAGSGWAGLRPHILHAIAEQRPCWLIFGERDSGESDALLREMRDWQENGSLHRLDLALSQGGGPYVQDIIGQKRVELVQFLQTDAVVLVCGRLAMGQACLAGIATLKGQHWLDQARNEGRLRQDLY